MQCTSHIVHVSYTSVTRHNCSLAMANEVREEHDHDVTEPQHRTTTTAEHNHPTTLQHNTKLRQHTTTPSHNTTTSQHATQRNTTNRSHATITQHSHHSTKQNYHAQNNTPVTHADTPQHSTQPPQPHHSLTLATITVHTRKHTPHSWSTRKPSLPPLTHEAAESTRKSTSQSLHNSPGLFLRCTG